MSERHDPPLPPMVQAAKYLGAGLSWVASTAVFTFFGYWADQRLGSAPWLTLIGAMIGAGAGFYSMLRQIAPDPKDVKKNQKG